MINTDTLAFSKVVFLLKIANNSQFSKRQNSLNKLESCFIKRSLTVYSFTTLKGNTKVVKVCLLGGSIKERLG